MNGTSFRVRGRHVMAMMLLFFGSVIAVNVVFATIAVRSFPGEDVRRSYLQGIQYNDTLAERRVQHERGWRAVSELHASADGVRLILTLRSRDGAALDGAAVTGDLQWPTNARFDRTITFAAAGDGRYVADLGDLRRGRWRLRAHAQRSDGALDVESELTWPS